MRKHFKLDLKADSKSDNSPVTVADHEINQLVISRIQEAFPDHAVLGEEASIGDVQSSEYVWVCDPIDGTQAYALHAAVSTFSIALLQQGKPIVAAAFDPFVDVTYHASDGQGAYCNGQQVHVNDVGLAQSMVGVSTRVSNIYEQLYFFKALDAEAKRLIGLNGVVRAGFDVARGALGGVIRMHQSPWDFATSALFIVEAGGVATDIYGESQRYDRAVNGFVGAAPKAHAEIVTLIREHVAK